MAIVVICFPLSYKLSMVNTTMVVVLQVILCYMDLYIEMSPPRSKSQANESQYRAAAPIFTQSGLGA